MEKKTYALDEDGKIQRNKKGSPIQAKVKNEDGKLVSAYEFEYREERHISADSLFDKKELHDCQADLNDECERVFGMKNLILNGRTKGGYTTAELKARTDKENELMDRENDITRKENELFRREKSVDDRERAADAREIEAKNIISDAKKEAKNIELDAKVEWKQASIARNEAIEAKKDSEEAYSRALEVATGYGSTETERKAISNYIVHGQTGFAEKATKNPVPVDKFIHKRDFKFNVSNLPKLDDDFEKS